MRRIWPLAWGVILIGIGLLFLADTMSSGRFDAGEAFARWWPLILLVLGGAILLEAVWPGRPEVRSLALDLAGAERATVRIDFGAGRLRIGRAGPGRLAEGTFEGGLRYRLEGPGQLRLDPGDDAWWSWRGRGLQWQLGLSGEVPLDLELHCGASEVELDLSDLRLASLALSTGAAGARVTLPRAAGTSSARIEAGMAGVRVRVPEGVAARIRSQVALGSTSVDTRRFPPAADGGWASPDYASATNRVEISLQGGLGSLTVE
ncbi:MAG: LiaF transmembrane domain-containing protein [Candidatus Limnocylindrales bacterium]